LNADCADVFLKKYYRWFPGPWACRRIQSKLFSKPFLVPELVEGYVANYSLPAASSRAKRAAGSGEVAF